VRKPNIITHSPLEEKIKKCSLLRKRKKKMKSAKIECADCKTKFTVKGPRIETWQGRKQKEFRIVHHHTLQGLQWFVECSTTNENFCCKCFLKRKADTFLE
jgi:hypothetical protein